jgi:gliding motility-associated-like protein
MMMKKYIFLAFAIIFSVDIYSQCSPVPVKEAVRNGDFEQGYLPNGGATDFYSDMTFGGNNFSGTGPGTCNCCQYGMADQYVVARRDTFTCAGTNFVDNTMWGISYGGDAIFADHTPGKNGDGYALLVDLNGRTISPKTGGRPIAWEQTVDVYPSESYFFSAWIANFSTGTAPQMQVTVIPELAGTVDNANIQVLPVNGATAGLMNWSQMTASWIPAAIYDKVTIRFEFVNVAGGSGGLDVAIDDISFINSCQNIAGNNAYIADFGFPDTINFCELGTDILLDPKAPVGQRANATIVWYEGTGNPQTQIDQNVWTKVVDRPGVYRVCIDDPDNGCPVSDQVVIIEEVDFAIPDIELCSPAQLGLDIGFDPNSAVSIAWSGPSGNTAGRTYTATTEGNHTVTTTGLNGHAGCSASDNFNVTSLLPELDSVEYCDGGGVDVLLSHRDGDLYKWAKDVAMTDVIGTGTAVNYSVPNGTTGEQIIYIQNAETSPLGTVGSSGGFAGYPDGFHAMTFTVTENVELSSIDVWGQTWLDGCNGAGTTNSVRIDISGPVNLSFNGNYNCSGVTTLNTGFSLPAGTYTLNANRRFPFNNTTGNLTTGAGKVQITSSGKSMFGNLVFKSSNACDPVPYKLVPISCCTPPADDSEINIPISTLEVCDPLTGELFSTALTNGLDYRWEVSYDNGNSFQTFGANEGTVAGGVTSISNVDSTAWYRLVIAEAGNIDKSCVKISDSVKIKIKHLPRDLSVTIDPNQTEFCKDEAHNLEASAKVDGGAVINYQWKLAGSSLTKDQVGLTSVAQHTYRVVADADGCKDSLEVVIHVLDYDTLVFTQDTVSICNSALPFDLNSYINAGASSYNNGLWSGTGVVGNNFDPAGLNGFYTVKFLTDGTCSFEDSITVSVVDQINLNFSIPNIEVCKDAPMDSLNKYVNASGGVFWGFGITYPTLADSVLGVFDPSTVDGTGIAYYGIAGSCGDTAQIDITVNLLDTITFTQDALDTIGVCNSENPFDLTQFIDAGASRYANGTWSGTGVVGNNFDPVGLDGFYNVTFTTDGSCPDVDSMVIAVVNQINLNFSIPNLEVCKDAPMDSLNKYVNASGGVFWGFGITYPTLADSVLGVFDPSTVDGTGIAYYGIAGSCGDTAQIDITVNLLDTITFTQDALDTIGVCNSENPFDLTQFIDAGASRYANGTWSGTGVVGNNFDPVGLDGFYNVTFTTDGSCPDVDSMVIAVVNQINLNYTIPNIVVCEDAPMDSLVKYVNVTGGVFWGFGVTYPTLADSVLGVLDPSTVTGTGIAFYGIAGSCGDTTELDITINPLDTAVIQDPPSFCNVDPITALTLDAANSTLGGTWTDSLGGNTYIDAAGNFNPGGLSEGSYKVFYTTPGACNYIDSAMVEISNNVSYVFNTTKVEYCINDAIEDLDVNTLGGTFWTYSGNGIIDAVQGRFDPSLATVGTDTIYYGKSGDCGDTVKLPITIIPLDIADITTGGVARDTTICEDDNTFVLQLSATSTTGGVWTGRGITDGATGAYSPAQAGEGIDTIVYSTNGGGNRCDVVDSLFITVKPRLDASITGDDVDFCYNDGSDTVRVVTKGGVWSGWTAGLTQVSDSTWLFDPTSVNPNQDSLFYELVDLCGARDTLVITVSPPDTATILTTDTSFCADDNAYVLRLSNNTTAGGLWSGTGITDVNTGAYDPTIPAVGNDTVVYTTQGSCPVSDTIVIEIKRRAIAQLDDDMEAFCGSDPSKTFQASETGGVFTGWGGPGNGAYSLLNDSTISFDPNSSGAGADTIFYTISGQCGAADTLLIGVGVDDVAAIDITTAGPFCQSDAASQLGITLASTPGGYWTNGAGDSLATYITGRGVFDPSVATVGNNANRVIYHTTGVCFDKDTFDVTVVSQIITVIDENGADSLHVCEDAGTFLPNLTANSTAGGTWRSEPVGLVNGSGQLDPSLGVAGSTYEVFYSVYGGTATCADSDSIFVRIYPRQDASISSFSASPTRDTTICEATAPFVITANNAGGGWTGGLGTAYMNPLTGEFNPAGLTAGRYPVIYGLSDNKNLCPDADTVYVNINPQVTITFGSTDQDVCEASGVFNLDTKFNPSPDSGKWFFNPVNPNLSITNADLGTINPTKDGVYNISFGVAGACGDTGTVTLNVVDVPNPAISNEPNAAVCIGEDTYDFNSTSAGGVWSISNGGTIDANTGVVDLQASGGGTFNVTYRITTVGPNNPAGCVIDSTVSITIEDFLIADINPAGPFCENLGVQVLSVSGNQTGTWGGAANASGQFLPQVYGSGVHRVSYRLQNACDTTFYEDIIVEEVPVTKYEIENLNATNCEPLTFSFVDNSGSPTNSTTWFVSTGDSVTVGDGRLDLTLMAGTYYAGMIQDYTNGCKDTLMVDLANGSITIDAIPEPDFTWNPNPANTLDATIQFNNTSKNAQTYTWDFGSRGDVRPSGINDFSPSIDFDLPDGDTLLVCLEAQNGSCVADTCKLVSIESNVTVFMPNAFTPNEDGLNDVFYPVGKYHNNQEGLEDYEFLVFNRWGEQIFSSNTPYEGWDGTYQNNGRLVQQDVYVWKIIVFDTYKNKTVTQVGIVTVVR